MICPKCGNEFQGTSCPKCDSPAILVNASDYERRKREWEEREKLKNEEAAKKQRSKEDVKRIAVEIANTDYKKVIASNANIFAKFAAKHRKLVSVFAAILVLAVAVAFISMKFLSPDNMQIYVSDGNHIYKGTVTNDALCRKDDIVYNSAGTKAFLMSLPNEIDKNRVISSMCSDNGKYFAVIEYAEEKAVVSENVSSGANTIGESNSTAVNGNAVSEGTYTVYAWKKGGQPYIAAQDKNEKVFYNISDDGILVFTDTTYMNEGAVGAISLKSSDISNEQISIIHAESVIEFLINEKYAVWLTTEGTLCYGGFGTETFSSKLAENVRQIYAQTDECVYLHESRYVQNKNTNSFIYSTFDDEYVKTDMSDIKKISTKELFIEDFRAENIIYESSYGCAYAIAREGIVRITGIPVKDNAVDDDAKTIEKIDGLLTENDFFYNADKEVLCYANENGELILVTHGKKNTFNKDVLISGVAGTTLCKIMGTGDAFTCVADEKLYYVQPDKKKTLVIKSGMPKNALVQAAVQKRSLYYIYDGMLYSVSLNKGTSSEIGKAKEIWIGSISLK